MNFPGDNAIKLSSAALRQAIEDSLNSTRMEGEDRIRVLAVSTSYSYGPCEVTVTTDPAEVPVAEVTELKAA